MSGFTKNCPTCNKIIHFKNKYKLQRSINNNSNCGSCAKIGENNPIFGLTGTTNPGYGYQRSTELKEQHSLFMKGYLKENPRVITDELRDTFRKSRLEWLKKNGKIIKPFYSKKACEFMDGMQEYNFQHALNGGEFFIKEFGYYVDGYDKEKNVIFEYDERHHFDVRGNLKPDDINRMNKIKKLLNCTFMRYNQIKNEITWH